MKLLYIGVCTHVRAHTHMYVYIYIIRTYIHLHIHITLYKTYVHTFLYYGIRSILGANLFMNRRGPTDAPTAAAGDPDTHKIKIQGKLKPI